MDNVKGKIFNIQRFSTHDGPGIRTSVFLKGCSLECAWCHNPESISSSVQLQYFDNRCKHCGECAKVCPKKAHAMVDARHQFDRRLCEHCGKCTEACMFEVLVLAGKYITAGEVMDTVKKDIAYYNNSGGGMTISGGEPLVQSDFVYALLKLAKTNSIHTVVDTSLRAKFDTITKIKDLTDLFLVDIKSFSSDIHKTYTGADNKLIMDNLRYLLDNGHKMYIRLPVIKGVNDSIQNAENISKLLHGFHNVLRVELLPYHNYGIDKASSLEIKQTEYCPPDTARLKCLKDVFRAEDIQVF
jgi:glycyl-radical enzyme activating protein